MNDRRTLATLAALVLLAAGAGGQTIKPLSFNTTNFTVLGPIDEALRFTNSLTMLSASNSEAAVSLEAGNAASVFWKGLQIGGEDGDASIEFGNITNSTLTRSNLFGSPGLSATITNSGLVFVFTNGILASTNAP
jgi:hypothetical protein